MFLFEVKESIDHSKKFRKNRTIHAQTKMAVLRQIKAGGAIVATPIFLCFFNVRYKITQVKAYSENLSF